MNTPFTWELTTIHLSESFRIAHGATQERQVIRLRAEGAAGPARGEAPFVPYYAEKPELTTAWLAQFSTVPDSVPDGPRAGRLALDVLRHDLLAQAAGVPLWKFLSLDASRLPPLCRSIGIPEDIARFRRRIATIAAQFPVLKLKLGSGSADFDEEIVAAARESAPGHRMFADANAGWSAETAAALIPRLVRYGLEFIEQPVGRDSLDGWRELRARLPRCPLPLFADESAQDAADVARLDGLADGVNVKLVKAGGIDRALEMIAAARARRMPVLLGCMIESSLGLTAAAHLAPLADLADLDGHLYLARDDFEGLQITPDGRLVLPEAPGLGVRERVL